MHAAVARSTFSSQNVQNTSGADRFLKFRCGKIARRCSEKHICNSKCQKNLHCRSIFGSSDVEKLHAAVARSTLSSQNFKKMRGSGHFLTRGCRKMVEKWHAAVAPSTFASQTVQNICVLHHFWRFPCRRGVAWTN